MTGLTSKQNKYYNVIKRLIEKNGYSPTVREIREEAGVTSTATVNQMLWTLKEKGFINFIPGKMRTITICDRRS